MFKHLINLVLFMSLTAILACSSASDQREGGSNSRQAQGEGNHQTWNEQGYQAYNEKVKNLFACDPNDKQVPIKIAQAAVPGVPSVLSRFLENSPATIKLNHDELEIFVKEFDSFLSLLNLVKGHAVKPQIEYLFTPIEKANEILAAMAEIESIKTSGLVERDITSAKIASAINNISYYYFMDSKNINFEAYEDLFGNIPGIKEWREEMNKASQPGYILKANVMIPGDLFKKYSRRLMDKQNLDGFQNAILSGFFSDRRNALRELANLSPFYRKFLQHEVAKLPTNTSAEQDEKHLLQSILRSDRFVALSSDPHVANLKSQFGSDILVDGIARASIAAAYLISCRANGQDRYFVAKTGVHKRADLVKQLDEELQDMDASLLLQLYPGAKQGAVRVSGKDKEFDKMIQANVKSSILEDVNFEQEAKNLYQLSQSYEPYPDVKVVKGSNKLIKGEDYLLMEYAPGTVLSEVKALTKEQAQSFNKTLKQLYAQIVFGTGPFHADIHAGNILVNGESFTLIDAGRIAGLSLEHRKLMSLFEYGLDFLKTKAANIDRNTDDLLLSKLDGVELLKNLKNRWQSEGFLDVVSIGGVTQGNPNWPIISAPFIRFIVEYKKKELLSFRGFLLNKSIPTWPDDMLSALRALNAIEHIYDKYIKDHGISGNYYGAKS